MAQLVKALRYKPAGSIYIYIYIYIFIFIHQVLFRTLEAFTSSLQFFITLFDVPYFNFFLCKGKLVPDELVINKLLPLFTAYLLQV